MAQEASSGQLKFSVDSSLLFQLGEQAVTRPSIALAELVKNSYDADATKVVVTLENIGEVGGTIVIEDNGHGMTFEEIQTRWMRIATTAKKEFPVSRIYCRPLAGAKGIGRFAARRLGSKLTLQSIAMNEDGSKEAVVVEFDWTNTFLPGDDLVEVPVSYTRQEVESDTDTGVSLLIEGARDQWTEDEIAALKADLFGLQSPFPDLIVSPKSTRRSKECLPDPGFDFKLIIQGSEELDSLSRGLGEEFLSLAWAKLEGSIKNDGKAYYELTILTDAEKLPKHTLEDDAHEYPDLKNARFRIYFMVYRGEFFTDTPFSVRDAQLKGRGEGGVRLYVDGFRVYPYGKPGDDWLQLDYYAASNVDIALALKPSGDVTALARTLRRPYLLIPKNQQVFGAVSISQSEHSDIAVNISRERLIETPTFLRLRHFVQNGIYWMTVKYAAWRAGEEAREPKPKKQNALILMESVKAAILALPNIPDGKRQLIIWNLDQAIEQARRDEEVHISEVSMLRILASAGTAVMITSEQLRSLIVDILQLQQDMLRLRDRIPQHLYPDYDDLAALVSEWRQLVESQASQLTYMLSPDSRQRRRQHPLREIVDKVAESMTYYMGQYGVKFENNVPANLHTPSIYRSEIYSVLLNVLTNALKAIHAQPEKHIAVDANRSGGFLHIRMFDTGVGLPPEDREEVFQPFVTTSLSNPILGVGTGLGLKIVRDILQIYGGTAKFIDAAPPWKTCIEITLPLRETT